MPRPKTDRRWEQRIFALKAQEPDLSAEGMAHRFEQEQGGQGHWPAARTIRRILEDEWSRLSDDQRRQYAYFRWPESMEDGSLPWEASGAGLELLRVSAGPRRPPVRLVKWLYRVTQAAPPKTHLSTRLQAALQLAGEEILDTVQRRRDVEWLLAFRPWESEEASQAYEDIQKRGKMGESIVRFDGASWRVPGEQTPGETQEELIDLMLPGAGRSVLQHLVRMEHERERLAETRAVDESPIDSPNRQNESLEDTADDERERQQEEELREARTAAEFWCENCQEAVEEPDTRYECRDCGEEFGLEENGSHRCPECGKFAAKVSDHACPNCGEDLAEGGNGDGEAQSE